MAKQQSEELINELIEYGVRIIKFCDIVNAPVSIKNQLIRSSTSIGANFSEAQDAASKKDFANKIYIAKKEASETKYWLKIVAKLDTKKPECNILIQDTQRFLMTMQKILNTLKNGDS